MFLRLLLLFTVIPILELALLIEIGRVIGTGSTILLVLGTGVVGALLAKSQGLGVIRRMGYELHDGRVPAEGLLDGLFILVGGVLLTTPGLMTDVVGFIFLIPGSRFWIKEKIRLKIYEWVKRGTVRVYIK